MEHKGDCFKIEGEFNGDLQELSAAQLSYSFLMMQNGRNLLSKGPIAILFPSAASRCFQNDVIL